MSVSVEIPSEVEVPIPTKPSNKRIFDMMRKWGWKEGNHFDGKDGPYITMKSRGGERVNVRPPQYHHGNPPELLQSVYRMTHVSGGVFWAGPSAAATAIFAKEDVNPPKADKPLTTSIGDALRAAQAEMAAKPAPKPKCSVCGHVETFHGQGPCLTVGCKCVGWNGVKVKRQYVRSGKFSAEAIEARRAARLQASAQTEQNKEAAVTATDQKRVVIHRGTTALVEQFLRRNPNRIFSVAEVAYHLQLQRRPAANALWIAANDHGVAERTSNGHYKLSERHAEPVSLPPLPVVTGAANTVAVALSQPPVVPSWDPAAPDSRVARTLDTGRLSINDPRDQVVPTVESVKMPKQAEDMNDEELIDMVLDLLLETVPSGGRLSTAKLTAMTKWQEATSTMLKVLRTS